MELALDDCTCRSEKMGVYVLSFLSFSSLKGGDLRDAISSHGEIAWCRKGDIIRSGSLIWETGKKWVVVDELSIGAH